MKYLLFYTFLGSIVLVLGNKIQYIDMPIDHFSFTRNDTFKLKYIINDTYWEANGPIFFYTGNEGTIEVFLENTGFIFDIAPQFSALIIFAEHRYYGQSLPFGNLSFTNPKYLGYLTSSQALADYVYLINYLQVTYAKGKEFPVIAFGGSYGGMLSAWLRMKYPATVVGAIAASAPIFQFQVPCGNFNKVVTDVYQNSVPRQYDCTRWIRKIWSAVRNIASTPPGRTWLKNEWKLCSPLQNNADTNTLIGWVAEILVNLAMANYPYPANFLAPLPAYPVRQFCYTLLQKDTLNDTQLISQFGLALEIYTNYTKKSVCNNINATLVGLDENAWGFQACTEIIMPICSEDSDMFENSPWNYHNYSNDCLKTYGVSQTDPQFPILEYGGRDIKTASNIVFSNGLLDPWSSGGVMANISATVAAVLIPEGAHHLDLRGMNKDDPSSVLQARKFHIKSIREWIQGFQQGQTYGISNYIDKDIHIERI